MAFLAPHNQGDGWIGLQDTCHKESQVLFCLSASSSALSPCGDFILLLLGGWPPAAPGSSKSVARTKEAKQRLGLLRSQACIELITVTRRNWPAYWSILCDSGDPTRQSMEHDWQPPPRGGPPKDGRNSYQLKKGSYGDPRIPIWCQPASNAQVSLLSDILSNSKIDLGVPI